MTTNKPEMVAVLYRDGSVLTKQECGIALNTCCKVETPLIRLSDYEALQAECEKLRKDAETERAIQRAAEVLPTGFRIEIEIEKDGGGVALFSPGAIVECDFHGGIAEQIADAIDAALHEKNK